MSVQVLVPGSPQEPTSVLLTTTAATDVKAFAAGEAGLAYVTSVIIANNHTSAVEVSVWWTKNTTDALIYVASVPAKTTVPIALDAPLLFAAKETARKIRAQAAIANVVTLTVVHTLTSQQNTAR